MTSRNVDRSRARVAALSRNRVPEDPELVAARESMFRAQQVAGASGVLDSVGARLQGDGHRMAQALRVPSVPMGVVLLEAVEMLSHLIGLSDRPDELMAALRERVTVK